MRLVRIIEQIEKLKKYLNEDYKVTTKPMMDKIIQDINKLYPDLKTEKDKLLIELGKLVANNEENAGYLLTDARYMYPDLTTLNRMEELIKQIGELQ